MLILTSLSLIILMLLIIVLNKLLRSVFEIELYFRAELCQFTQEAYRDWYCPAKMVLGLRWQLALNKLVHLLHFHLNFITSVSNLIHFVEGAYLVCCCSNCTRSFSSLATFS